MTSMPLTWRTVLAAVFMASALAVGRRARRELLLRRVLRGGAPDQGLEDLLVGLQPVGAELPGLAVPRVDAGPGRAHVVDARGADGAHHAGEAERVELGLREVQVLEAPADLLAVHRLALAEAFLRGAHALDAQHRAHRPAHVEHLAHF